MYIQTGQVDFVALKKIPEILNIKHHSREAKRLGQHLPQLFDSFFLSLWYQLWSTWVAENVIPLVNCLIRYVILIANGLCIHEISRSSSRSSDYRRQVKIINFSHYNCFYYFFREFNGQHETSLCVNFSYKLFERISAHAGLFQ